MVNYKRSTSKLKASSSPAKTRAAASEKPSAADATRKEKKEKIKLQISSYEAYIQYHLTKKSYDKVNDDWKKLVEDWNSMPTHEKAHFKDLADAINERQGSRRNEKEASRDQASRDQASLSMMEPNTSLLLFIIIILLVLVFILLLLLLLCLREKTIIIRI